MPYDNIKNAPRQSNFTTNPSGVTSMFTAPGLFVTPSYLGPVVSGKAASIPAAIGPLKLGGTNPKGTLITAQSVFNIRH